LVEKRRTGGSKMSPARIGRHWSRDMGEICRRKTIVDITHKHTQFVGDELVTSEVTSTLTTRDRVA
jgi:hypothetical protein